MDKNKLRERLADIQHDIWAAWMGYLFSVGQHNQQDGTWTMPKWAVERWARQLNTAYVNLTEQEKDSDREQADKVLNVLDEDGE